MGSSKPAPRQKVLRGEVAERLRELVRQTCEAFEIRIVRGEVSKDHAHSLVSAPPNLAPSEIMRRIKDNMGHCGLPAFFCFSKNRVPSMTKAM